MSASLSSVRKAKPARANNRRGETLWSIRLIRTKLVFAVTGRVRGKISGTAERPRLDVFRSAKHIYCQVIDDEAGVTLASASTLEKDFEDYGGNCDAAKKGWRAHRQESALKKALPKWSMTAAVSYTTAVLRHLLKVPVKPA